MTPPSCTGSDCPDDGYHDQRFYDVAYAWLAERIGFWPLFLTVGTDDIAQWSTGYFHQFRRGATDERVLFSWRDMDGVFIDDGAWNGVLCHMRGSGCSQWRIEGVDEALTHALLAPGRSRAGWMARARRAPVQLVVPALDMAGADRIVCRSQRAGRDLIRRGFDGSRIHTGRVPVDPFSRTATFRPPVPLLP